MRSQKLVADPLWQCLCPAWNAPSRITAAQTLRCRAKRPPPARSYTTSQCRRSVDTASRYNPREFLNLRGDHAPANESTVIAQLRTSLRTAAEQGQLKQTNKLAAQLVKEHGVKHNIEIYNDLILVNINSHSGAAWRVDALLRELQDRGIPLTSTTCHNVLKVLAVHPDHLLRAEILDYMKEQWFTLTPAGHCDVVAGLLREGCFEMALFELDNMRTRNITIPSWLSDMVTYMLVDAGEMDLVYRIMRDRWSAFQDNISETLWIYCLDLASTARHLPLTEFIWRTKTAQSVQFSTGLCVNVMSTAARHGKPALANSAFRHITARGEPAKSVYYQLLIDAYTQQSPPLVDQALTVLCVMSMEKLQATDFHTRSLYTHFRQHPESIPGAMATVGRLKQDGKNIPIAALNLIIESYIEHDDYESALKFYKRMHSLVAEGKPYADVETFNLMLKGCRTESGLDLANIDFLLAEIDAFKIKPDSTTFDRLMSTYLRHAERSIEASEPEQAIVFCNQAIQYLEACQSTTGEAARYRTAEALMKLLSGLQDQRCWQVFQTAVEADVGKDGHKPRVGKTRRMLQEAWGSMMPQALESEREMISAA